MLFVRFCLITSMALATNCGKPKKLETPVKTPGNGSDDAGAAQESSSISLETIEAELSNLPGKVSTDLAIDVGIGGKDIASYQYALLSGETTCTDAIYGTWRLISKNIREPLTVQGERIEYALCVIGRNTNLEKQSKPTVFTWSRTSKPVFLESVEVTPENLQIVNGGSGNFIAIAHYSDGSDPVITDVATFSVADGTGSGEIGDDDGEVIGSDPGSITVQATYMGVSGDVRARVIPRMVTSLSISPANLTLAATLSNQFTVNAVWNDGTQTEESASANYASTNPNAGAIDTDGVFGTELTSIGTTRLTASFGGRSAIANVTTTPVQGVVLSDQTFDAFTAGTNVVLAPIVQITNDVTAPLTQATPGLTFVGSSSVGTIGSDWTVNFISEGTYTATLRLKLADDSTVEDIITFSVEDLEPSASPEP